MTEEEGKVEAGLRFLEKLTGYIPGFKGYKQKEIRRESDRLIRGQAAMNLKQALDMFKRSLSTVKHPISDDTMLVANEISARLDTLKEKISKSQAGFSGFFDAVKIKEKKLDKVLELDYTLISQSKTLVELSAKFSKLAFSSPEWKQLADDFTQNIEKFEESLRERETILSTA